MSSLCARLHVRTVNMKGTGLLVYVLARLERIVANIDVASTLAGRHAEVLHEYIRLRRLPPKLAGKYINIIIQVFTPYGTVAHCRRCIYCTGILPEPVYYMPFRTPFLVSPHSSPNPAQIKIHAVKIHEYIESSWLQRKGATLEMAWDKFLGEEQRVRIVLSKVGKMLRDVPVFRRYPEHVSERQQ